MKKTVSFIAGALVLLLMTALPALAEIITVEGSIQGLLMTINGKKCEAGMEHIVVAVEDQFVLVADKGDNWYVLPKFKGNQLAPYLGRSVKVEGMLIGKGKAIDVKTGYVDEKGTWKIVYSQEIVKKQNALHEAMMNPPSTPN